MARPTGRDVARLAGVAQSSVSLVFSGKASGRLSADLEGRIRKAAAELGYQPVPSGRALQSGRSNSIGLVVTDFENGFFGPVSRGAQRTAAEMGYSVLLIEAGDISDFKAYQALKAGYVDALLVFAVVPEAIDIRDRRLITLMEAVHDDYSSVVFDSRQGLRAAVAHLHEIGHQRIGYFGVDSRRWTFSLRREAYFAAMAAHGLSVPDTAVRATRFDFDSSVEVAERWLRTPDRPSAIICADDLLAAGLYRAAAALSLSIPVELSVVSFGGTVLGKALTPALSSLSTSPSLLGETAIRLQLSPDARTTGPKSIMLPLRLETRQSTASQGLHRGRMSR